MTLRNRSLSGPAITPAVSPCLYTPRIFRVRQIEAVHRTIGFACAASSTGIHFARLIRLPVGRRAQQWPADQPAGAKEEKADAMRILMTTECVGDVWTCSIELARALEAHDVEVVLATMGPPPSEAQRREAHALWNVTLHESRYKLEWQEDPWSDVHDAGQWLLDLQRRHRADVIHLNGYAHGGLDWEAPVVIVAHSCMMSWWQAVRHESVPPAWARYWQEVRLGLAAADVVVAPTHAMLGSLRHHYGALDQAQVIPHGRSHHLYSPRTKQPVVLSAGSLADEAKNLATLQRAAGRIRGEVRVVDDQPADSAVADAADVTLLEQLTAAELATEMARAAVYALPARYEPFGLSVVEAAMSGCALVLGDIPSQREIWRDAATYVDPDDAGALAEAVNELLDNPSLCAARGEAAALHAIQYSPQRMARQYYELYDHLHRQRLPQLQREFELLSPEIYLG